MHTHTLICWRRAGSWYTSLHPSEEEAARYVNLFLAPNPVNDANGHELIQSTRQNITNVTVIHIQLPE